MICPAILDPFQGANYRLVACMHQALLCPIISKLFGYMFTPASLNLTTIYGNKLDKSNATSERRTEVEDIKLNQVKNVIHGNFDDINNGSSNIHIKTKTTQHNECHTKCGNGKQIENGCDISKNTLGGVSIPGQNDSNKKTL